MTTLIHVWHSFVLLIERFLNLAKVLQYLSSGMLKNTIIDLKVFEALDLCRYQRISQDVSSIFLLVRFPQWRSDIDF